MSKFSLTVVLLSLVASVGCGGEPKKTVDAPVSAPAPSTPAPTPAPGTGHQAPTVASGTPRIVFLGDSLTFGLGLDPDQSFPSMLQRRLTAAGYHYEVINAGVSGDTSAGGLRRLDWSLDGDVKVLVVALGGNDGLRGLPPTDLRKNLTEIVERASSKGITVVLAGMEAPPNNGPDYTAQFREVYADLARNNKVKFIPFLLQGVAGIPSLNQGDGIHPNLSGEKIVADLVWATLEPLLSKPSTVAK